MTAVEHEEVPDFLQDPEPREQHYTIISVDDHVVEPATIFDGRLPERFVDAAPKVVELPMGVFHRSDGGTPLVIEGPGRWAWVYEGEALARTGLNAVVGHKSVTAAWHEPTSFADMRPGCYDAAARIRDMDISGVWAQVNFPSGVMGFANTKISRSKDPEMGMALTRAWNDWMFEEWHLPYPERIVPVGVTYLADPDKGADEIRRNAERGFVALSFPESPHHAGFPSLHTRYWDPILRACEETDTVVCLHVGSGGALPVQAADGPGTEMEVAFFPIHSMVSAVDWMWSGLPARFPGLRLSMAEGGIGWVPLLVDRLTYMETHSSRGGAPKWHDPLTPVERLRESFWFCMLDDPSALRNLDVIGEDRVMVETDYPHSDSTWPDSQEVLRSRLEDPALGLGTEQIRKITHANAAALFRHPLPPDPRP
jgi:predicted TIM-barrel fold metal-dependent hydrolase